MNYTVSELRAEVERLTRERDEARATVWAVHGVVLKECLDIAREAGFRRGLEAAARIADHRGWANADEIRALVPESGEESK